MTDLTTAQVKAGLVGSAPKPFRVGRYLTLIMTNGRVCRGVVTQAGRGAALMEAEELDGGRRRNLIINYKLVHSWKPARPEDPPGNWMPDKPGYAEELAR